MTIYLETERLLLRDFTTNDEQNLFDLDADPAVVEFLTQRPSTREEVLASLDRVEKLRVKFQGRLGVWAAIERSSGKFIGWFHFRPGKRDLENTKRIELGYRLQKSAWGKGYAQEGSRALIKKGFEELNVEEVFALTMETNIRSRNVMEKCGLTYRRSFVDPEYGSKELDVEYALKKSDFKQIP
jgi:RimJ/RimL family protein N-acetyltransferase